MARPEINNVNYFPHPVKHGKKMFYIENKYGNDGYAVWFKLLEELGDANYHYLDLNKDEQIMYLSSRCRISEIKLFEIIDDLVKFGEFDKEFWDKKILVSEKFIKSIEDAYKKRNNKCITLIGLRESLLYLSTPKLPKSNLKGDKNPQSKVKERKGKESKEDSTHTISLKKELFQKQIDPYIEKYDKEMLTEFFKYWTEPNKSLTKLRWELQVTWDINLRLQRWAKNYKPKKGKLGNSADENYKFE